MSPQRHSFASLRCKRIVFAVVPVFLAGGFARVDAHPDTDVQIETVSAMLRNQPARVELFIDRASLYLEHERFDLALQDYQAYAKECPDQPVSSHGIGRVLSLSNRLPEAEAHYRHHLKRYPRDAAAYSALSAIQGRLKQLPAAITSCRMAIECRSSPQISDWLTLIRLEESMVEPDLQAPRATLRVALTIFPANPELVEFQIRLAEKASDWPTALVALDQLMQPLRRKEVYLARKAALLEKSGNAAAAAVAHRETLATIAALPDFLQAQEHVQALVTAARSALKRLQRSRN